MPDTPFSPNNIRQTQAELQGLYSAMVENAAHIARARRAIFEALKAEGFTEAQALDLCWRV
ncbi:hypothetical protein [Sphingobium sp. CFD-1]|uniref:hypothetical protein n=1 Tax=Sphingobium sp. CFD-1 TaxID=2878545 RepID=UPI00214C3AA2|nr:hypothetical protein [Sphingobium sp. CFD-1]